MGKLHNRRGETLVETLCAVLVLALAVALLAAMLSASFRLDRKTDEATGALYQAFSKAEKPESGDASTAGTVSVQIGAETSDVNVTFYGNQEQIVSYRTESGGGAP